MGTRIPEEKIQEVRERTDIVEVVSSYLPLKRSGHNHLGLCPFHAEKTPSFNVNAARQIFHCFGCDVGGNVFNFLMRMEGLSFPEAARRLGARVGIEISEEALSPAEEKRREEFDRLARINEVACDYYHGILLDAPEGALARRYLRDRGYDGETARRFRLGCAPDRWDALARHLEEKGFDAEWARDRLGLIRAGKKGGDIDLFRNRLLFPIRDLRERVVAFGGRVLDDSLPKYINSPESPLYQKGRVLYGLCEARESMRHSGEVIVVEGYFDHLALERAGFKNVVATCGTALTEEHGRILKRYAERVLLLFDQDKAGKAATYRAMDILLSERLAVSVVRLDADDDPDSFLRTAGEAEFRKRIEGAQPVLEVFMEDLLSASDGTVEGKTRAAERVLATISRLPGEIEKTLYLQKLAQRTGVDAGILKGQMAPAPRAEGVRSHVEYRPSPRHPAAASTGRDRGMRHQEWLLRFMISDLQKRLRVEQEGTASLFENRECRAVADAILANCREEEAPDVSLLLDRLSEGEGAILSGILLREEKALEEESADVFEDCLQAAFAERLKARRKELPLLIRRAEEEGAVDEAKSLQTEQLEINRRLKSRNFRI